MGLLDFNLNSAPRPELFSSPGLLLAHPWSAQPQSLPGVPNSRVSLECPTPECPKHGVPSRAQIHSLPKARVSPECPAPESPWSAQPQSLPGVPTPECPKHGVPSRAQIHSLPKARVSPECPAPESPWSAQPQSLPGVPTPECCPAPGISTKRGWGCSK